MIDNYLPCQTCPLRDRPPVFGVGPRSPEILVLGEAPGAVEAQKKVPFIGKSGQLLRRTLESLHVNTSRVYFTNACLCWPEENATPPTSAIVACQERLLQEISEVSPEKILAVGGSALAALQGGRPTPITKNRGIGKTFCIQGKEIFMVPTYHPAAVLRDPQLFRDFSYDLQKLLSHSSPLPPPEIEYLIPSSPSEVRELLETLSTASTVSCDLETTGFNPLRDQILSIGFGVQGQGDPTPEYAILIPKGLYEKVIPDLTKFFVEFSGDLVFHNIKFDIQFLYRLLGEISLISPWDTMLMQYVLDERGTGTETESGESRGYHTHGLKDLARVRYDIPDYHFDFDQFLCHPEVQKWVQGEVPLEDVRLVINELLTYQGLDCVITYRLYHDLLRELRSESPRFVPLLKDFLIPAALFLARVELTGAPVDREYLQQVEETFVSELSLMEAHLDRVSEERGLGKLNYQSPPQVKKFLQSFGIQTPSSEREVVLLEIQKLKKQGKLSDEDVQTLHELLDYRQKARTLSKDIRGLLSRIDDDGRVRPDYLLHGSATGRLACRDPNLQNVPTLMGPIIRKAITEPDPDYVLMEADESQLELRVAGDLSGDLKMIQTFKQREDIHRKVASDMFMKPAEEITHHERYLAKYVDFGVIYGRGAKSLTEGWEAQYIVDNLGGRAWTLQEAQAFVDNFLNGFPQLKEWITRQHEFVKIHHYVDTPMGRRRRFPLLTPEITADIERRAVNTPIQSFGSDIVLSAVMRIERRLPEGAQILPILVHDSIMLRVRKDLLPEVVRIVKEELQTPPLPMKVPLVAEVKVGRSWGDMVPYEEES